MKSHSISFAMVVFGLLALLPKATWGVSTPVSSMEWATRVLEEVLVIPQGGLPRSIFNQAQAVVVFPGATRSGLAEGGRVAEGVMVSKNPDDTWSNPALVSLREPASGSSQAGLTNDFILVFTDREGVNALGKAPLVLGSDVTVEGGPLEGVDKLGSVGQAQVYSYSLERGGELAGLALTGVVLQFDRAANEDFYDTQGLTLTGIFTNRSIAVPVVAGRFKCTLAMHTHVKQMCG